MLSAVPLTYTIASSTPHSGRYGPENILVDKPLDQSSRWSGAFQGNANQWIVLRLESLAVLKTVTFGKFSKPHPCNMKELKVFVGISEDHMTEVLHAGLKNDSTPETFSLRYINDSGVPFPTQFVKIVPILAHGQNFHISIWHVSLSGIVEPTYVEQVRLGYDEFRETAVLRYVLKHLRQRRLLTPYQSILSRANIHLEHPLITQLHETLVLRGDFTRSEALLNSLSTASLFSSYLQSSQPHSLWTRLRNTEDADGDIPPARGGHAMCIDSSEPGNEMIYLFGGWNGERSLDDFWRYSVREGRWKCLCASTTSERNAPGARSCHKMAFDKKTGSIYVLGRLNDADGLRAPQVQAQTQPIGDSTSAGAGGRSSHLHLHHGSTTGISDTQTQAQSEHLEADADPAETIRMYSSEFYRYHTRGILTGKWDFLSIDTAASGGPPLIFDHQMIMDSEAQILYVFGGRVVDGDWDTAKYSGLYSYNVSTSKWKQLQPLTDTNHGASQGIPSRFGHSMVFDPYLKTLFIFAGQREDKYLSDMYTYNVETGIATEVFSNFSSAGGPEACFTQRAVIDPVLKEIYVFCGLTRPPMSSLRNSNSSNNTNTTTSLRAYLSNFSNWVYRYDSPSRPGKWMQILPHPSAQNPEEKEEAHSATSLPSPSGSKSEMPIPRFAHQVVYNPNTKTIFLHGGNSGGGGGDGQVRSGNVGKEGEGDVEEGRNTVASLAPGKERRLDDFWRMELKRPGPEEVIRQVKFGIRRQQFREMCEDGPPIKALNFLQTQVSSVVDHSDVKETETFRALLTHLLAPPPSSFAARPGSVVAGLRSSTFSPLSEPSESFAIEHEDSREGSTRPRKRSRGERDSMESIEKESGSEAESSGVWTNELLADGVTDGATIYLSGGVQRLREIRDPLEDIILSDDIVTKDDAQQEKARDKDGLTGARYAQRTEVFESILKFVVDSEKQPEESLLDLVESDRCRGEGVL